MTSSMAVSSNQVQRVLTLTIYIVLNKISHRVFVLVSYFAYLSFLHQLIVRFTSD